MTDEATIRAALQQQAQQLRHEFPNLDEIRNLVKPSYNALQKRAEIYLETPFGTSLLWWHNARWTIRSPRGTTLYAMPNTLRDALRLMIEQLKEDAIRDEMEDQANYLRSEYGDLEEIFSWARPVYNYEKKQAEVRFDTPVGLCVFLRDGHRWRIHVPDGTVLYAQPGDLREKVSHVRQYLRQGVL